MIFISTILNRSNAPGCLSVCGREEVQGSKKEVGSSQWQLAGGLGFKVQGSKKEVGSSQWQLAGDVGFKVQGSSGGSLLQ